MRTNFAAAGYMPIPGDRMMIISDIRGDSNALKRALSSARLDPSDPFPVLCLGNLIGEKGNSSECIRIMREINATCIRGELESRLLAERSTLDEEILRDDYGEEQQTWLENLPQVIVNDLFTGINLSTLDYQQNTAATRGIIRGLLSGLDSQFLFVGHAHVPMWWAYNPIQDELHQNRITIGRSRQLQKVIKTNNSENVLVRHCLTPGSVSEVWGAQSSPKYLVLEQMNHRQGGTVSWYELDSSVNDTVSSVLN